MKWSELKKEITSLTPEEKAELELMASIAKIRKQKSLTIYLHQNLRARCDEIVRQICGKNVHGQIVNNL